MNFQEHFSEGLRTIKLRIEILSDINEEGHDISEAFDRLQNGRPLKDKDLFTGIARMNILLL